MQNCIIFDYLSATLDCRNDPPFSSIVHCEDFFFQLLGMDSLHWEVSHGVRGFDRRFWFDGISIHTPSDDMPFLWLEMSGSGCRAFESYGVGDWDGLFRQLLLCCSIKRLDLAFDDHTGLLPLMQMVEDTSNFEYVSKARNHEIVITQNDCTRQKECSIYHGSKSSDTLIRIYDKARQLDQPGHWVRCELQLRNENAHNAVRHLVEGFPVGDLYYGLLNNYFRYVDPDSSDSNRWRWPVKQYWSDFTDDVQRVFVAEKKGIDYNLASLDNYTFNQAGNSIRTAIKIYGAAGFWKRLKESQPSVIPDKYKRLVEEVEHERSS